jgi:hypothetical protein
LALWLGAALLDDLFEHTVSRLQNVSDNPERYSPQWRKVFATAYQTSYFGYRGFAMRKNISDGILAILKVTFEKNPLTG